MSVFTRLTRNLRCPVCGGHPYLPAGQEIRCAGFLTDEYAHCVPPGAFVAGSTWNTIESSFPDVLSHDGLEHKVTNRYVKPFHGDLVRLQIRGTLPLVCTPEHPILVLSPRLHSGIPTRLNDDLAARWLPASQVAPGMHVLAPHTSWSRRDELAWLLGSYAADGVGDKNGISWVVNPDRVDVSRLEAALRAENLRPYIYKTSSEKCLRVRVNSRSFAREIRDLIPGLSHEKGLPSSVLGPAALSGLLHDGYNGAGRTDYLSTSLKLALQVWHLAIQAGFRPSIALHLRHTGYPNAHQAWRVGWSDNPTQRFVNTPGWWRGRYAMPVTRIDRQHYTGPVYNLSVDGAESFTVNGIITHNCTRENFAGNLEPDNSQPPTYAHLIDGTKCRCGVPHARPGAGAELPAHRSAAPRLSPPVARAPKVVIKATPWNICDVDGNVLAIHTRLDHDDGGKSYSWSQPNGKMGLNGCNPGQLIYGLETLQDDLNIPVVLTEGERSADALRSIAGPRVTVLGTTCGAPKAPDTTAFLPLQGRRAFLWPDNDEVGLEQMRTATARLIGIVTDIRLIHWGEREKDDAADFVERGGTATQFRQMALAAPQVEDIAPENDGTICWADVKVETVEFLWYPYLPRGKVTLLEGMPNVGKGHPLGTPILTPTGWRPIETLVVGEDVIGSDGRPTRLTGIFPRGRLPVFRVTMNDRSSVVVDGDHLWQVQSRNGAKSVISTCKLGRLKEADGHSRWRIPMVSPVEFVSSPLELDPYILGVWLGDGSSTKSGFAFTPGDNVVPREVESLLPPGKSLLPPGIVMHKGKSVIPSQRAYTLGEFQNLRRPNPMVDILRNLGLLGKRSWERWIPKQYLLAPLVDRISLLQGIMDTDGGLGSVLEFGSTSRQFVDDVSFLIEGLGGTVRHSQRIPHFKDANGNSKQGRLFHRMNFKLPFGINPFRCRHQEYAPTRESARFIASVDPVGEAEIICLAVAAKDHLYVTEHCIVTHNSFAALGIAAAVTRGFGLPGMERGEPGTVLFLSAEDGVSDTLKARIEPMLPAPDMSRIRSIPQAFTFDHAGLTMLDKAMARHRPALVIFDPLMAYFGGRVNINQSNETRQVMTALYDRAMASRCAILGVRHLRKGATGDPLNAGLGSIDITAAARSILLAGRDPQDETKRGLVHTKQNLSPQGPSVGYRLDQYDGFTWTGFCNLTAEKILGRRGENDTPEMEAAVRWLRLFLGQHGLCYSMDVIAAASAQGMTKAIIFSAAANIPVQYVGVELKWGLPAVERVETAIDQARIDREQA